MGEGEGPVVEESQRQGRRWVQPLSGDKAFASTRVWELAGPGKRQVLCQMLGVLIGVGFMLLDCCHTASLLLYRCTVLLLFCFSALQ